MMSFKVSLVRFFASPERAALASSRFCSCSLRMPSRQHTAMLQSLTRLTVLHRLADSQFVDVDVKLLSQTGCEWTWTLNVSVRRTDAPDRRPDLRVYPDQLIAHTTPRRTYAGFHHMSMSTTLLQQVKFRPVLPALNEIRMSRMVGSVLIFSRLS